MYYTYILRCENDTLYTGMTSDLARRMREHFGKTKEGAKYTKSHSAKRLEAAWESADRSHALRLEARIKRFRKPQKERLIKENAQEILGEGFGGEYRRLEEDELSRLSGR